MSVRHLTLTCIASTLIYLALSGAPASACTGAQFVAKRSQVKCDRKLTLSEVETSPYGFVGVALELKGTVGGSVMSDGNMSVMLNMKDGKAVMLEIPAADAADIRALTTPDIRALVQVKEGASGNVVPLRTLAVAYESVVVAEDRAAQARQDAARKRADWKKREQQHWQETIDRAMHRRTGNQVASRGETVRLVTGTGSGLSPRVEPLYPAYYRFIQSRNTKLTAAQVSQITFHLLNFADRYNVDPRLVVSMIIAESDFDTRSTSHSGAMGLGQLMPETARDLGLNNPYDIVQNLNGSVNYLRSRLDMFGTQQGGGYSFDQVALAMAAYNAGENAVKRYHGVPPYRATQAYVKRVISLYQQLCR